MYVRVSTEYRPKIREISILKKIEITEKYFSPYHPSQHILSVNENHGNNRSW